jgi:hypothetical protein
LVIDEHIRVAIESSLKIKSVRLKPPRAPARRRTPGREALTVLISERRLPISSAKALKLAE